MRTKRIAAWILTGVLTISMVSGSGMTVYAATESEDVLLAEPESDLISEVADGENTENLILDKDYDNDNDTYLSVGLLEKSEEEQCPETDSNDSDIVTPDRATPFVARTTAPEPDNPWYYSNKNVYYGTSYGPPAVDANCTWYAFGRASEILGQKARCGIRTSDNASLEAKSWYANDDGYPRGSTPKLGAVACKINGNHVAVVEDIVPEKGEVVLSNSAWGGDAFYMTWHADASAYNYIYIGDYASETVDESATVTVLLNENEKTAITYSSLEEATASFENDFKDQRYTEYSKVTFAFNGNVKLNSDISFPKGFPYVIFEPAKSETIDGTVYYDHTLLDFNGHKIEHFPTHPLTIKGISCISSTDDDHPGLIRAHGIDFYAENTTRENAQITVLRNVNLTPYNSHYSVSFYSRDPSQLGKTYIVDSQISSYSVEIYGNNCTWKMDRLMDCGLYTPDNDGISRPCGDMTVYLKEIVLGDNREISPYNRSVFVVDNIIVDGGCVDTRWENGGSTIIVNDTLKVLKENSETGMATVYNYGYLYINKLDMPCGMFRSGGYADINDIVNLHKLDNTSSILNVMGEKESEDDFSGWVRIGTIKNMTSDGGLYIADRSITQIDGSAVISNLIFGQDVWGNETNVYSGIARISRLSDTKIDISGEFHIGQNISDETKLHLQTVTRSEDPNRKGSYIYSDPVTTSGTVFTTNMKNFPVDKIAVIQPAKTDGVYQDGNKIIVGKKGQKPVVVKVTSIKINETNPEVAVGQTTKLTYSYEPVDATNADATWKSANTKVAKIDPKTGEVTGISPGTSKITVTAGGRSASTTVTVVDRKVALTGLTVDGSVSLNLYENKQLNIVKTPEDATDKITCISSDPSVVFVNDNGIMTGLKAGAALVTVRGGDLEEQCIVTVKAAITQLKLDKTDVVLTTGQKTSLTAQASPEGIECSYIWSVSVAQISENRIPDEFIRISPDKNRAEITALKPCDAEVTVSAADNEGNTRSTVARITVKASDLTNSEDVTLSGNETEKIIEALEEDAAENDGRQGLWISGLKSEYEYNGMPVEPEVTVYHGTTRLQPGKDYSIAYADNKKPYATGTIKVTGKGSYSGKTTQTFKIVDNVSAGNNSLKKASVTGLAKSYDFTGNRITPDIEVALNGSVLTKDVDYTLSFSKNVNAGTARLVIEGIGGYKDNIKKTFKINAVNMADPGVKINAGQAVYMAGGAVPIYSVTYTAKDGTVWTLREGIDYKTRITQNKLAGGKGILTVIGQGNFVKKAAVDFDVTAGDLSDLIMSVADLNYKSGQKKSSAYQAKVKIIDKDGKNLSSKDYSLAYKDVTTGIVLDANTSKEDLGKVKQGDMIMVTAAVAGGKNYSGELVGFYKLVSNKEIKDINKAGAVVVRSPEYDGGEKTPGVTLTWGKEKAPLTEGTDYKIVSYYNNVRKGTAYAIVQGMGSFSGTKTVKFTINASDVDRNYLGAWNSKDLKFVR